MNNTDLCTSIHDVLESQQGDFLKYLTVKEVCILQHISKTHSFCKWSKIEIDRRYQNWLKTCSKAWGVGIPVVTSGFGHKSVDDIPLLESTIRTLENIAKNMSGGLEIFLHNRESGAPPQPELFAYGKNVRYTTLGDEYESIPIVAMFDIYCDGKHMWNGVRPIVNEEIGNISFPINDDYDDESESSDIWIGATYIELFFSNSLGDKTDEATYHPFSPNNSRPNRYLISTDAEDIRTWTINLSFLTEKSKETLVRSVDIRPDEILNHICMMSQWDDQESALLESEEDLNGVILNEKVKRCSGFHWMWKEGTKIMVLSEENKLTECSLDDNDFDICFWLDERDPSKRRFHVTTGFSCENTLLAGMILNGR
ncbi:predicted protein [Chaetoceros tenuissimus]|uniref:Uncharacterized protein n=1 Tax=Chaetoceros tenuissimus TaxID=426638 RepID=A0AAD3CQ97_9STRA|nr:predicted protein [Chaetoceros tenuissimus]